MKNHGLIGPTDWKLYACNPESGREHLLAWGPQGEAYAELLRMADKDKDVWLIGPEGTKVQPADLTGAQALIALERLLQAADNHAEDAGEPDHAVGDLQDLLRAAWALMTAEQRHALVTSNAAEAVIEAGGRGEFDSAGLVGMLT